VALAAAAASDQQALGIAAVLYYLAVYALMKLGSFLLVAQLGGESERHIDLDDFRGLAARQPAAAACFALFLLSLLGLPATAGFLGKFFAFQSALDSHRTHGTAVIWLVVIAAINSVIGAYYYLRVMISMYFAEPTEDYVPSSVAPALAFAIFVAAAGTLYLGLLPAQVLEFARTAADSLPLH